MTDMLAASLLLAGGYGMIWPRAGFAVQIVALAWYLFLVKNGLT